jgi:hypothetical protein
VGLPPTYAGVTLVFVVVVLYACSGPRGSDQFWYLGDTMTLLAGEPPLTNFLFPGPLLRDDYPVEKSYFVHHTLVSYMVLPFAGWLGAYHGWIAFNIVCALTAAVLIAAALHRLASPSVALIGYSVFLLLPLTIWQTANMLQEVAFCMMTALLTVLYVFGERSLVRWIAIFAVCGVAVLCHPLYLPVAGALPFVFLWQKRHALKVRHFVLAGVVLGAVLFLQTMKSRWFPSTFEPSLTAKILSTIPGQGNMEWHFRAELPALTLGLLISKAWHALKCQLALLPTAVFFWPANVLLLGSMLLISHRNENPRIARLVSATAVFMGLFALLICSFRNQFRYSLIITPAILISTAVYAHRAFTSARRRRVAAGVAVAALLGFATIDTAIARRLHREGKHAAVAIEDIRRQTESLANDQCVVIEVASSSEPLMLAYALRPRKCLILKRGYLPPDKVQWLLAKLGPKIVFCRPGSDLPEQAGATRLEANWPGRYHEFEAYEVRQAGRTAR